MNPAKNADEPTFGQGFVTGLWNNGVSIVVAVGVVAAGAALVAVTVPVAVVTAPVVVGGGVVVAAGAAAYGGYQTGLAASQLATGAEVNQLGVATGRQLTPAELGEKAADVTVGGAMIGAGAASALRGRWAAQAAAGAEAQGAAGTWRSWLPRRKTPNKPGSQGNRAPANPSEPTSYGGENPDPWTPPPGSSQPGVSPGAGPGGGAGAKGVLSKEDQLRIQRFANTYDTDVHVVGSRAKGTAGPKSDYDYILGESGGNSRLRQKARGELPRGNAGGEIHPTRGETGIDVFNESVDPSRPHITIRPNRLGGQ